jgi:hypothetical protein
MQKRAVFKKSGYKKPRRATKGKGKAISNNTSRKHQSPKKVRRQNRLKTSKSTLSAKVSAKSPNRRGIIVTQYDGNSFPSLVAPHYFPLLGPFGTLFHDIFDYQLDIASSHLYCAISENNVSVFGGLYIGEMSYTKFMPRYTESVHPHDVMSALTLLSYLYLEGNHVDGEHSKLQDSAMRLIKDSSKNLVHFNSLGKVNKKFITFVIDFLALSYLFDVFAVHKGGKSPAPYPGKRFSYDESLMFMHNQRLFVDFFLASSRNNDVARHMNTSHGWTSHGWAVSSKYETLPLCEFIEIYYFTHISVLFQRSAR